MAVSATLGQPFGAVRAVVCPRSASGLKRSSFEIELHSVLASSTNGANGAETRPHRVEIPRAHSRPSNFQGLCLRG